MPQDRVTAPHALVVGAGAGGMFCSERLLERGWTVDQASDVHIHTTTLLTAAGLIEPVGADQRGHDDGDLIVVDPADGTAEMLRWCRELADAGTDGVVPRRVLLLGETDAAVEVPWADAVEDFTYAEPPPGQDRYRAARTYGSFVVQPDLLVRRMLDEFHASRRWTYRRQHLDGLDDVQRVAMTAERRPDVIVVAAGNYSGTFSARSAVRSALGIIARLHTTTPIPESESVTIATTARTFPYDIPAWTLRTFGGSFLEGVDPADLRDAHVEDFADVRDEIVDGLADIGIAVPADVTWMIGGRPVHPLGPHVRLDHDGEIPVIHVSGLSGSGVTEGRAIGRAASMLAERALQRSGDGRDENAGRD